MINLGELLAKHSRENKRKAAPAPRPKFQQSVSTPLVGTLVPQRNGTYDLSCLLDAQTDNSGSSHVVAEKKAKRTDSSADSAQDFTPRGWPVLSRLPRVFQNRQHVLKWCEIPEALKKIDPQVLLKRNGANLFPGITFLEKPHEYWLSDEIYVKLCKAQGKPVTAEPGQWKRHRFSGSATAVAGKCFSPFVPDEAVNGIVNGKNYKTNPDYEYFGMTPEQIKLKWLSANMLGTLLHYLIELFYNGYGDQIDDCLKEVTWRGFLKFHREHVVGKLMPYLTEMRVYDLEYDVAGSIDAVMVRIDEYEQAQREGRAPKIILIDWKRTSKLSKSAWGGEMAAPPLQDFPDSNYYKYGVQLNVYKKVIERNTEHTVEAMYLCRFNPNLGEDFQLEKVEDYGKQIDDLLAIRKAELALKQRMETESNGSNTA